jgi:hypothetical protein
VRLAVTLAREDGEVAPLVQLGMAKRFGSTGKWCVAAGRGQIVYNARTRVGTRILLRVAGLSKELREGAMPPGSKPVSVLIFQPAADEKRTEPSPDVPSLRQSESADAGVKPVGAKAIAALQVSSPRSNKIVRTETGGVVRAPGRPPLVDLPENAVLISHAARSVAGGMHASQIVGGVLANFGLHSGCAEVFAKELRNALRAEWGSSWHVVVGARTVAVAPPAVLTGEWIELELNPAGEANSAVPLDPSIRDKTPARYRVMAFRSSPGAGEPPVRSSNAEALISVLASEPLILIKATLYSVGFAAFIAFLGFSQGADNKCSRLSGAGIARLSINSIRFFIAATGVFSSSPERAAESLQFVGLDLTADEGAATNARCSAADVLSADVRIVRGRYLILCAGFCAVVASFVLRYVQMSLDIAARVRASAAMKAADAPELARAARGAPRAIAGKKAR